MGKTWVRRVSLFNRFVLQAVYPVDERFDGPHLEHTPEGHGFVRVCILHFGVWFGWVVK